eukprot:COSAG02_NODE_15078_length_1207_cov_0.878159_1_plen_110_part_10
MDVDVTTFHREPVQTLDVRIAAGRGHSAAPSALALRRIVYCNCTAAPFSSVRGSFCLGVLLPHACAIRQAFCNSLHDLLYVVRRLGRGLDVHHPLLRCKRLGILRRDLAL